MGMVQDDNYYVVQAWMVTRLKLKGLEKDLFAIIYGFSQDGEHDFHGSLEYLAQLTGYTKNRICDALSHLTEITYIKKAIIKDSNTGVKQCIYRINKEILDTHDYPKDLDRHPKDLDRHPKDLDRHPKDLDRHPKDLDVYISNKKENKKEDKENRSHLLPPNPSIQRVITIYNETCNNLPKVQAITDNRKKGIKKLLSKYSMETIKTVFSIANNTAFLTGKNDRGWKANLDFILREDKFVDILEGKYGNTDTAHHNSTGRKCDDGVISESVTEEDREYQKQIIERLKKEGKKYAF